MKKMSKEKILTVSVLACLLLTVLFDVFKVSPFSSEKDNYFFLNILTLSFGAAAVTLLMLKEETGLFKKPTKSIFLLLGLLIAVDNFQFAAFFAGKMQPIEEGALTWLLFASSCLLTGFFEEGLFRGILFPVLASRFKKDKSGLLKTVIVSSLIFGGAHLLNILSGANIGVTLLQVGYSMLTGALFAFILIKTKNIVLCAVTHGVYNFCGLLFSAEQGLGAGVVLDLPTALTMLVVSSFVVVIAVISFINYKEEERVELYKRLGFGVRIEE